MKAGMVLAVAASAVNFIFCISILVLICNVFTTIGNAPNYVAHTTMTCDMVVFGEKKAGVWADGLATSANSLGAELGTGLGAAILDWGLAIGRYVQGTAT
jgi:GPH family glycoside/pentoside/hexuronide:cation symporter